MKVKREKETLFIFSFFFYQVTDYAIARRIVDLHTRNVESVERVYSTEEIQRYILFARQFQPKARCYSFFTRILFLCCRSPCLFVIFWGLLDIQNKVIQVWNDTCWLMILNKDDNWPPNPASVDLPRGSGVRGGPVQASAAAGWKWNQQISLEDHREAAGEHVASVWGHGQTLLLRWGVWCSLKHQVSSGTSMHQT